MLKPKKSYHLNTATITELNSTHIAWAAEEMLEDIIYITDEYREMIESESKSQYESMEEVRKYNKQKAKIFKHDRIRVFAEDVVAEFASTIGGSDRELLKEADVL
jgi:hypothetical protein